MDKKLDFVRKRDGRVVPFDRQKIADAIFRAARSLGGQDKYLAEDLAEAVRLYLLKQYEKEIPSVEDIQDIVERVLIKTGHARTAKAYILYREKRARIRRIREGIRPEDADLLESERHNLVRNVNISVRESSDNISLWNKERIIDTLVRETGLSPNIAELIVGEVEEEVLASKVRELSSSLVRELVNAKLAAYGFEEARNLHARLGVPVFDVRRLFEEPSYAPDSLSLKMGRHIKKEFALLHVIPGPAVEKHLTGEIFIHNLEGIDKFFSVSVSPASAETLSAERINGFVSSMSDFVDGDIVIRVPACPPAFLLGNLPSPVIFEIDTANACPADCFSGPFISRISESFPGALPAARAGRIGSVNVSRPSGKDLAILNRMTIDISLIRESRDFPLLLEDMVGLCLETMEKQEAFMSEIHGKRGMPEILSQARKAVEVELAGSSLPFDTLVEGFLTAMRDLPEQVILRFSARPGFPLGTGDIMRCMEPFIKKGMEVRVYHV